ncbi:hypothetical protein [Halobaculum sp. MBLA0143]|uniref:hypothetical protein n=1 Tax=Halobaculum sp. MBLA0143 TaxID=3079933 RepID=UPI0035269366
MSSDDTDGYVHRPGQARDDDATDERTAADEPDHSVTTPDAEPGLGSFGWALVAVVALAFLGIPGLIYVFPTAPGDAGLPFLVAMLALPFVPALLLGVVAVWTAVSDGE